MQNANRVTPARRFLRLLTRVALIIIGLPAVLLGVLVLLQVELDLSPSRNAVADLAGWILGGEVQIDGDVRLGLGSDPTLTLSGVHVRAAAGDDVTALDAERLVIQANIGALLWGRLEHIGLVLEGGQANVGDTVEEDAASSLDQWLDFAFLLERRQLVPDRVNLEVKNTAIAFTDDRHGTKSNLQLVSIRAMRTARNAPFELQLSGNWDERPLSVNGGIRASETAGEQGRQLVSLSVQLLGVDLGIEGEIARSRAGELHADLALDVKAEDLSAWRGLLGVGSLPVRRAEVKARIRSEAGLLALENIDASLDRTTVTGVLSLQQSVQRPAFKGELQLSDLDMVKWQRSFQGQGAGAGDGDDLFEWLAALPVPGPLDADLSIKGSRVVLPTGETRNVDFNLVANDRMLKLMLAEAQTANAGFEVLLEKQRSGSGFDYRFVLRDPKIDLASLVAGSKVNGMVEGDMAADIELRSSGGSASEVRSALNGEVELVMGAGKANVGALDKWIGGLTQALGSVFTEKSALAVVNCSALDAALEDGVITIMAGLVDTSYSTVVISGKVDVGSSVLDLDFVPFKKALSLSVAPEVHINGTLQKPSYDVKKRTLLVSLGEFIVGVARPELMLVGVFKEAVGQNPCVKMLTDENPGTTKKVEEQTPAD